jgi:MoxR-like ATPase
MGNVATTTPLAGMPPSVFANHAKRNSVPGQRIGWDSTARTGWFEIGPEGQPGSVVRGILTADPAGSDAWSSLGVSVGGGITQTTCERLNRLLSGLPGGEPVVKVYWRNKSASHSGISVQVPGTRGWTKVPAFIAGGFDVITSAWRWSVSTKPALSAAVHAPVVAPTAPAPAASAPAAAPAPVVAPEPIDPPAVVAPAEPVVPEVVRAQPKRSAPLLPVNSIFRDPATLNPGLKVHDDPVNAPRIQRAVARHAAGHRTVVALTGPTGTGKTLTATEVAKMVGLPYLKIDAAGMGTFADWAGSVGLKPGAGGIVTEYAPSMLIEAVRADGPYAGIRRMVLLDECNRVVSPSALSAVLPLTDGSGTLYVPDAHLSVPIDPAVLWVFTANIGSAYSGTVTLDAALVSRVTCNLSVEYPSPASEATMLVEQGGCSLKVAEQLVRVATQTRALSASASITAPGVSTRQLISAAIEVAFGASPLEAAETAFVQAYDSEGNEASDRAKVRLAAETVLRGA